MAHTNHWLDLSPYGLSLKAVLLASGEEILLIKEPAADEYAQQLTAIGLQRRDSGVWFKRGTHIKPLQWKTHFPKAKMVEMNTSDFVEIIGGAKSSTDVVPEAPKEVRELIGLNKNGQQVFVDEHGERYIQQPYNRLYESKTKTASCQQFLRSDSPLTLLGCAEAFLITIEKLPNEKCATLDGFVQNSGANREDFSAALLEAVNKRLINDKDSATLGAKYKKSLELQISLAKFGFEFPEPLDNLIVARRLLGMDRDMIGETVSANVKNQGLLKRLLPERGVIFKEDADKDASLFIDFAASPRSAAETILARGDGATTITFIDVKTVATARKVMEQLVQVTNVESAAFVSAKAGGPKLIVSSMNGGQLRGEYELKEISEPGDVWSWASVTTSTRAHAIEAFKAGTADMSSLTAAAAYVARNAQQIPYASASKISEPTQLVPKELKDPTNQALDRLISTYGDVDDLVAREYGFSKDDLGNYFLPEQVDFLGLSVLANARGRAILNADGAGSGKGRCNMANAKREISKGRVCLLLTESAINFSDVLRDAKHLGMLDNIKVGILNENAKVIDEDTGLPFQTLSREEMNRAIETGVWPEGIDLVVGSYSQFNSLDEGHKRTKWLQSVMSDTSSVQIAMITDEIHNAANTSSNTSANIAAALDRAASVYMSSATHAHTTQMASFYARLLPDGIDTDELRRMMIRGGQSFQEILTSMLVADGVMVRRERNVMDMTFKQSVDTQNLARNSVLMDQLAVINYEMAKLSGSLDDIVDAYNNNEENRALGREMRRMGLGGPLHHMARLFDAALMAETVALQAVESLKNGGKPVILTDNTIHALLEESAEYRNGDAPDFKDVLNRVLSQIAKVSIINRGAVEPVAALEDVAEVEALEEENVEADFEGYADGQGAAPLVVRNEQRNLANGNLDVELAIKSVQALIKDFPDLPASAIDVVKNTLRKHGYTCGEITGRQLEIGEDGKVRPRSETDKDRVGTKNGFNSGKIDAVIINSTGATGTDLHAGERFADQRQRHFHILQAPDKVQKEIQAVGRVSRTGEVVKPEVHFHSSGLPYRVRLDSMRNNKLRFASATITGNRDTMMLMQGIPDLINDVGDQVVWDYAQRRPDLITRLCLSKRFFANEDGESAIDVMNAKLKEIEDAGVDALSDGSDDKPAEKKASGKQARLEQQALRMEAVRRNSHLANEFLSRLALLPVSYQEKVLQELSAEYELTIAELDSKGVNPLRPREIPGIVHQVGTPKVLQGSADALAGTAFDGPVNLMYADIERVADAISSEQVMMAVDEGSSSYDHIRKRVHTVLADRDRFIEPYLPAGILSVQDALLRNNRFIRRVYDNIELLADAVDALAPGREVKFVMPQGDEVKAIVTGLKKHGDHDHLLSSYYVNLAVPGETRLLTYNLTSFLEEQPVINYDDKKVRQSFNVYSGLEGNDYEAILAKFDDTTARKMVPATFLTTNIFQAVRMAAQSRLGQLVSFVGADGQRQKGVLLTQAGLKRLDRVSIRLDGAKAVLHALVNAKVEVNSSDFGSRNSVIITPTGSGSFYLRLPSPSEKAIRRGEVKSDAYMALLAQTEQVQANLNRIHLKNEEALIQALEIIMNEPSSPVSSFYVAAKHRDRLGLKEENFEKEAESHMKMAGGMR